MKTMKKLCALLMALFLTVGICAPSAKAASTPSAEDRYDGGYRIEDLLARFQYAVKGDVTMNSEGHTVGAVAVGGKFNLQNNFANIGIVPSYISDVVYCQGLGDAWSGYAVDTVRSNIVYYGIMSGEKGNGRPDEYWFENPEYMNIPENFHDENSENLLTIEKQSEELAKTENGAKEAGLIGDTITIDLTSETESVVKYVISEADYKNADSVILCVDKLEWFQTNVCVVSIRGGADESISFNGNGKMKISVGGEVKNISNLLKTLDGTENGGQMNLEGMNLIWNFPDATEVSFSGLGGHLVAPKAVVNVGGGNYEGGIIASELTGGAEGHFFPMTLTLGGEPIGTTCSISFEGTKTVTGNAPSETYKFEVKEGNKVVATGKVTGAGKITFTPITYNTTGTYTYKITEVSGNTKYMKYDATEKTVVVVVSDESGTLTAKIDEKKSDPLKFENKLLGELVVNVFDEETGDKVPNAEVEVTYPDGTKHTHKTDSTGSFTIEDAEPGSYDIEVKEVPDGYTVTQGKTESAEVEAGKRTVHDAYINIASSNDPGNGSTPGGTTGGTTGDTPGAGSAGQTPGGGTGTTVTGGTSNSANKTNTTNADSAVRTGDDFNLLLPIVLLVVSGLGIGIIVYRKKKSM